MASTGLVIIQFLTRMVQVRTGGAGLLSKRRIPLLNATKSLQQILHRGPGFIGMNLTRPIGLL